MQKKFEERALVTIESIKASDVNPELKDALVELVENARIATNGLSHEEKIQTMSENQFSLAVLMVHDFLATVERKAGAVPSWREVVVQCRREILAIALAVVALLLFRPNVMEAVRLYFSNGGV